MGNKDKNRDKTENLTRQEQIYLLSVDSSAFFTDEEKRLFDEQMEWKHFMDEYGYKLMDKDSANNLKDLKNNLDKIDKPTNEDKKKLNDARQRYNDENVLYLRMRKFANEEVSYHKKELIKKLSEFSNVRQLNNDVVYVDDKPKENKVVGQFTGILTRLLGLPDNDFTEKLIIVKNYYHEVMSQILDDGFDWKSKHYVYLSSGSGQIKDHKMVCIEQTAFDDIKDSLTCGLTIDEINKKGGVNPNKYNSYLSLAASASYEWEDCKRQIMNTFSMIAKHAII
ncbi:MAG: hypothetical protein ABF651_01655, partial [Sporolactobacillus sp.]